VVAATPGIEVHRRTEVQAVLGTDFVEGVRVREAGSDARVIPCAGFFAFIGLQPATDFLPESVARDARGGVITDATLQTSIPGVFAAGAVRSGCGGTVADAIADGEAAARAATAHLALNR